MEKTFILTHVIISIALIAVVLMQNKDGGLSAMMGGGGSFQATKRGAEKVIYWITIILATLFLVNGILFVFM